MKCRKKLLGNRRPKQPVGLLITAQPMSSWELCFAPYNYFMHFIENDFSKWEF